jgi:hypothetical protein
VHSGDTSSTDEFLIYFDCILTITDVLTFTVCFSLQAKYKEEMIKRHGEEFNWENESIDNRAA